MVGNALPLILRQGRKHRKDTAEGDRDIVDIVHGANGFAGERHGCS
jgi:hypothetical protein